MWFFLVCTVHEIFSMKIKMFLFLQRSTDLKEAGVFHLCITFFTSASVKSGIYSSPVSDRVDKTPNGWLTEWVHSVRIRRETLTAFADNILSRYSSMSGCQSFPFCVLCTYVWLYMWLFSLYANGYWQHDVMCLCLSVSVCFSSAYMELLKVSVNEQCTEVLLISINWLMLH